MAGVGRYLYDKDAPVAPVQARSGPRPSAVARPSPAHEDDLSDVDFDALPSVPPVTGTVAVTDRTDDGGTCPVHHTPWVLRPAGISKKTGAPYDPFYACGTAGPPYCKEKPVARWVEAHHP
jgi:hypothetical protein